MNEPQQKHLEEFLTAYAVEHTGDKKAVVVLKAGRWALGCWETDTTGDRHLEIAEWVGNPNSDLNYVKRRIRNSVDRSRKEVT